MDVILIRTLCVTRFGLTFTNKGKCERHNVQGLSLYHGQRLLGKHSTSPVTLLRTETFILPTTSGTLRKLVDVGFRS